MSGDQGEKDDVATSWCEGGSILENTMLSSWILFIIPQEMQVQIGMTYTFGLFKYDIAPGLGLWNAGLCYSYGTALKLHPLPEDNEKHLTESK